ncbi:MAG: hypothetical protein JSW51_05565, partial [Gemmatimonadota bacterium]
GEGGEDDGSEDHMLLMGWADLLPPLPLLPLLLWLCVRSTQWSWRKGSNSLTATSLAFGSR